MRSWPLAFSLIAFSFAHSLFDPGESVHYNPVTKEIVETRLKKYKGNDKQREETLKQMFLESGCDGPNLTEQAVKGTKLPNLICVLPGASEKVIIVGAHYDHVIDGDGVVDNWSGASLLPSLYESLKREPRTHTYIFVGFCDEERGEVGSRFYAHQMTDEQVAATDAMVNMDTLGLAHTEIWASHSDKKLTTAIVNVANLLKVPIAAVNVEQIGSTDSVQFSARKIPSITIHSLTQETWNDGILHSYRDRLSAIHLDDYYETYQLVAGYVAYLDRLLQPTTTTSTATH
jgi:putative aminopeptidase FrvX